MNWKQSMLNLGICAGLACSAGAEEGMWLFNQPPQKLLQERYQFNPEPSWLEHLMKSSVRLGVGGSGSFVSPDGLVMTNHHVAADAIQKLSKPGKDLMHLGFMARTRAEELPCVDLELNVLQSIEDVTPQILAATPASMDEAQAEKARRAAINTLEQEERQKTGLRCDVVTLFKGGAYHLYRYKRYTDVRLVFAPELGIAFFGGDCDNFEYPRQCLDVAFLRVYENGKPLRCEHYLKWSASGVKQDDLVFVSGHPGRTHRLNTVAHLKYFRDVQYPFLLDFLRRFEVLLNTYGERSGENFRQCQDERYGVQNGRKARIGGLQGLQDPAVLAEKTLRENQLRQRVAADPGLKASYGDAYQEVEKAIEVLRSLYLRYTMLEQARAFNSQAFHYARALVRRAVEMTKPNAERLREFGEAHKDSLEQDLFSTAPHYPEYERVKLADSLALMMEQMGAEDPLVQKVLQGKSPQQRAQELIMGSRVLDVGYRRELAQMDLQTLKSCNDPMIALAWTVEPESREARQLYDKSVALALEKAYGKIARASMEVSKGQEVYPDATFSLRLSLGQVKGYAGFPFYTDFASLYKKSAGHQDMPPFTLPFSWVKARSRVAMKTPLDFVCTADIIGGNSGSPVVNRAGEVVGLIFDGNLESLVWDFQYTDQRGRALAVDVRGIQEALRKVYGCSHLADEILGKSK